jgi:hypothetical protein
MQQTQTTTPQRKVYEIAQDIRRDWGSKVNPAAKPYLSAMLSLNNKKDMFGADSADSIILYFLTNASSYRGETAKRLKAELKALK